MTPSEKKQANKTDIRDVLVEFSKKKDLLESLCRRTKDLIEVILGDAGIRYQSIQTRVKSSKKLEEKYLDPKKNYCQLRDITDQAGIRVITYYEDDVDRGSQGNQ